MISCGAPSSVSQGQLWYEVARGRTARARKSEELSPAHFLFLQLLNAFYSSVVRMIAVMTRSAAAVAIDVPWRDTRRSLHSSISTCDGVLKHVYHHADDVSHYQEWRRRSASDCLRITSCAIARLGSSCFSLEG